MNKTRCAQGDKKGLSAVIFRFVSLFVPVFLAVFVFLLVLIFLVSGWEPSFNTHNTQAPSSSAPISSIESPSSGRLVLTRGFYGELTMAPEAAFDDEQANFLRDLYEGLTAYDTQGNIVPAVAESWQTEDNQTWRFQLRAEAKWSNGEPVTAQDFVKSWQYLARSDSRLKQYLAFLNLAQAEAVLNRHEPVEKLGLSAENDRTLLIQLDKPTPYLPAMLAHSSLLPRYFSDKDIHSENTSIITNGAYRLATASSVQAELAQNVYYWNRDNVSFKQVRYQKMTSETDFSTIDLIINAKEHAATRQYFPKLCSYFYEFNLRDPELAKSAVRKAIVSLISVKDIASDISEAQPSAYLLPKSWFEEQESQWEPVVAEQLLVKNGINEKTPLSLRVSYDTQGYHPLIAEKLIRQLTQSDLIRATGESLNWASLQERRSQHNFQLIRSGWCADFNDPAAFLSLFYSKSPDNKSGYANEEFDCLFERAMQSVSAQERSAIYIKLHQVIQHENLVLPLFHYRLPVFIAPSVMGAQPNSVGVIYSKNLWRSVVN